MTLARWFALLASVLGSLYVFTVPPMQVPDEPGHFNRAYTVSTGHCLAPPTVAIPKSLFAVEAAYPPWVERVRSVLPGEFRLLNRKPVEEPDTRPSENSAANLYSCVPYLPAAAALRVSLAARQSAIVGFYAARIANLLVYVALVYAALQLLPRFQLLLFTLALMPMALHQAASLSADAVSLGMSFLYCGYVLRLVFAASLSRWDWWRLIGLSALLCLCKFNIWLVLLVWLIPGTTRRRLLLTSACVLAGCLAAAVWQQLDLANLQAMSELRETRLIFMQANSQFLLAHPFLYLRIVANTFRIGGLDLAGGFIGLFGWRSIPIPVWLEVLYYMTLGLVAVRGVSGPVTWTRGQRLFLVTLFVGSVLSLCWLMYILEATRNYTEAAAIRQPEYSYIPNVQGRYLIYFAIPLLLAFAWRPLTGRWLPVMVACIAVVASLVAQQRIRSVYAMGDGTIHAPEGSLDLVQPDDTPGRIQAHGWAVCADGLKAVQVFVDGQPAGEAVLHIPREDVGGLYLMLPEAYESGWVKVIDLRQFPPGPHRVTAVGLGARGSRHELVTQAAAQHAN